MPRGVIAVGDLPQALRAIRFDSHNGNVPAIRHHERRELSLGVVTRHFSTKEMLYRRCRSLVLPETNHGRREAVQRHHERTRTESHCRPR
jgi:hypothetical protein